MQKQKRTNKTRNGFIVCILAMQFLLFGIVSCTDKSNLAQTNSDQEIIDLIAKLKTENPYYRIDTNGWSIETTPSMGKLIRIGKPALKYLIESYEQSGQKDDITKMPILGIVWHQKQVEAIPFLIRNMRNEMFAREICYVLFYYIGDLGFLHCNAHGMPDDLEGYVKRWEGWWDDNKDYLYKNPYKNVNDYGFFKVDEEAKKAGIPTEEYRKAHPWPEPPKDGNPNPSPEKPKDPSAGSGQDSENPKDPK